MGCSAQELSFVDGPKIISVTPKDQGATIGFLAPKKTSTTPEILEYEIQCSVPGSIGMGVAVFILEDVNDMSADIYGLENGMDYSCNMVARGATDGLLPRAINSAYSNPTPIFSPSKTGSATIYVKTAEDNKPTAPAKKEEEEKPTSVPPTNPEQTNNNVVLPKAPSIKDMEVNANGNVEIIFGLPAGEESSPIKNFIVACQNNGDSTVARQTLVPAGSTSAVVEGLSPGEYTCSVAASTADGIGASATRMINVDAPSKGTEQSVTTPQDTVEKQDGSTQPDQKSAAIIPTVSAVIFSVLAILLI